MIKKLPVTFICCLSTALFVFFSFTSFGQQRAVIKTIIVDAGHGGRATGAKGSFSYEKDICLDIALKLGKKLEETFPEVKILYTRKTDVYTDNRWRADFANSNKGDLFIS